MAIAGLAPDVELDAGAAADDGTADVFQATVVGDPGDEQLQITINGEVAYEGALGAAITINGSADQDVLTVTGSNDHPAAWDNLIFNAGGGDDRLELIGWSAGKVQDMLVSAFDNSFGADLRATMAGNLVVDGSTAGTLDADAISALLWSGTTVTLETTGEIVIEDAIDGTALPAGALPGDGIAGGGLILKAGKDVTVEANITTNAGRIEINTGTVTLDDVLMKAGTTIDSGAAPIEINAKQEIKLATLKSLDKVTLSATEGSITNRSDTPDAEIFAHNLTVTAAGAFGGSGANGAVDVDAQTISLSGIAGGIFLDAVGTGSATVSAETSGSGDIRITSSKDITLQEVATRNAEIRVTAVGQKIVIQEATTLRDASNGDENGNDDDIVLTGKDIELGILTAGPDGDIVVTATDSITDADGDSLLTADEIQLMAVHRVGEITFLHLGSGAPINIAAAAQVTAKVTAADAQVFLRKTAGTLTAAQIQIDLGTGQAAMGLLSVAGDLNASGPLAGFFTLSTGDSVGLESDGTLTLRAAGVDVGIGDLRLRGGTDIIAGPAGGRVLDLSAAKISIESGSSGGDTTLWTQTDTLRAVLNSNDLIVDQSADIELASLVTGDGSITVTATGAVTARHVDSSATDSDAHDISLSGASIELGTIDAGSAGDVQLTASAGAIDDADNDSSVTADVLTFAAASSVGGTNAIETRVATIGNGTSTAAGDIAIEQSGDLVLLSLSNTSGSISVKASGKLSALDVTAAGGSETDDIWLEGSEIEVGSIQAVLDGDVTLVATTDGIYAADADSLIQAQDATLDAVSRIGEIDDFHAGTGLAIRLDVAKLVSAKITAAGGEIFLRQTTASPLEAAPGAISVAPGAAAWALISSAGDLDFSGGFAALVLDPGDSLGLRSDGTLTLPDTGIDVGSGDLHLHGAVDVLDSDHTLGLLAAVELSFSSSSAGGDTVLTTAVTGLRASLAQGDLRVEELDAVDLIDVSTVDGAIAVTAGGTITATRVQASDDAGDQNHDVMLSANAGDILVGSIVADDAAILSAPAGAILDDNASALNVTAVSLALSAQTAIGTITSFAAAEGDAIEVQVTQISQARTSAAGSAIHLSQDGSLTLVAGSISAAGAEQGQVILQATGDLNAVAGDSIDLSGGDDLRLSSQQTLTIPVDGLITAGNLHAIGETDVAAAGGGELHFTADHLLFDSGGVAGGETLHTDVNRLTAHLKAGDLAIDEADGIVLDSIVTEDGAIAVVAAGPITVGAISAGSSNDVQITSAAAVVDDGVSATRVAGHLLTVRAHGGIELDTAVAELVAATSAAGDVRIAEIDAISLLSVQASDGAVDVAAGGTIRALGVQASDAADDQAHDVKLTAANGNILLGSVVADNTAELAAPLGSILDDNGDALNITAAAVNLSARTAIGTITSFAAQAGDAIEVAVGSVTRASTTGAGSAIHLDQTGDLAIVAGAIQIAGSARGQAIIRTSGDLSADAIDLAGSDDLGLNSQQTLTIPQVGFVTAGDLRMVGLVDVTAALGGTLHFAADELLIGSGGGGGNAILSTSVNRLSVSLDAHDLVVNESTTIVLDSIVTRNGAITVEAGGTITATVVDSSATDDGTNTIQLTTTSGEILVGAITAGSSNDMVLNSASSIGNDSDAATRVQADVLTAAAGGAITLDTSINSLTATTTAAGELDIHEVNAISLTNTKTYDGAIRVDAGGAITAVIVDSSRVDDGTNSILLTTRSGDIHAGTVAAGIVNNVQLESAQAILDDGIAATRVHADGLEATASGPITLDTSVARLTARTLAAGDIDIDETDAIVLNDVQAADGSAIIVAGGSITAYQVDIAAVDEGTHAIRLTSGDSIQVGELHAGTLNDAYLSAAGRIDDDGTPFTTVTADHVTATASGAISLDTRAASLIARTTATGAIWIRERNDIELIEIAAADGSIAVDAGGSITALNVDSSGTDNGANSIRLAAGGDILVSQVDAGTNNDAQLDAVGAIAGEGSTSLLRADVLEAVAGGAITLRTDVARLAAATSGAGDVGIEEVDAIVLASIVTANGAITVQAGNQITATHVDSSAQSGAIELTTGDGQILVVSVDSGTGATLLQAAGAIADDADPTTAVTAGQLTVRASGPIDLDTDVDSLSAATTATGDIEIREANGLVIDGIGIVSLAGAIEVNVAAGDLAASSSVSAQGIGSVTLTAASGMVRLGPAVSAVSGDVAIRGRAVLQQGRISTGGFGTIVVTADGGSITMADLAVTGNGGGQIRYASTGHVLLTRLSSVGGAIVVVADSDNDGGGAIRDNLQDAAGGGEGANLITSETALTTLYAGEGIGSADQHLDTSIGVLQARTAGGDIYIDEASGLVVAGEGIHTLADTANIGIRVAAGNLTIASSITAAGVDPDIQLTTVGDLYINRSVITSGDGSAGGGTIVGRAGGMVYLDASPHVILQTGTGRISRTDPLVYVLPHEFMADTHLELDDELGLFFAMMDRVYADDPAGWNYRLDVDWGVTSSGIPSMISYRVSDQTEGGQQLLLPDIEAAEPIMGHKPTAVDPFAGDYKLRHAYDEIDFMARDDPSAPVPVVFTYSFDYRGGDRDQNGIQLFNSSTPIAATQILVIHQVDLNPPVIGITVFPPEREERVAVVQRVPDVQPRLEIRSRESASVELFTPLSSATVDPQEHIELWRVTARGEEVLVTRWPEGDASVLDGLPELFRELGNDHYRLYLMRGGNRIQIYFDVLIRQGQATPVRQAPAAPVADDDGAGDAPPAERDQELPADPPAGIDDPAGAEIGAPESAQEPGSSEPHAASAAMGVAAAALLVPPADSDWSRRVDETLKRLGARSMNKLARIGRGGRRKG